MAHFLLSSLCFVLWAVALNLVLSGMLLGYNRVRGSALLFTAGLGCLVLLLGLGVYAHIEIAYSFRYAGLTLMLRMPLLLKRTLRKSTLAAVKGQQ